MKITKNDYAQLKLAISSFLAEFKKEDIEQSIIVYLQRYTNIENKYRAVIWVLYNKAIQNNTEVYNKIARGGLYNDNHIETALKKIFKNLNITEDYIKNLVG